MYKKYLLTSLFSLFFWVGLAQRTELKGKIRAYTDDLEGIHIINLNSNSATTSENGGYFKIAAQENDTLQFSAVHLKGRKVVVTYSNLKSELFFVNLELANYNLNEVKINEYKNINALDLGILSKPAKKFTVAERRMNEATTGSGLVPLNPILNAISGRTAMLKKEIEVEKKEYTIKRLNEWFEDHFYTDKFKIPLEYVKGFQFYLVENTKFVNAVKTKNKTLAIFIIGELSSEYLKIINEK